jgi:SAM-dependent methyltransferase
MDDNAVDWDAYTKDMGATGFPVDLLLRYSGDNVLDVGCGIGRHLAALGPKPLKVGVEISLEALKRAQELSNEVLLIQADAYRLPFPSSSFDTALSIDVVEHLEHPSDLLREMFRILLPHGRLILQTPNYPIKRLYDVINYIKPRGWRKSIKDDSTHIVKLSWRQLERLVKDFVIIESRARNILLESKLPFLIRLKGHWIGKPLGQKTIIVAMKPG